MTYIWFMDVKNAVLTKSSNQSRKLKVLKHLVVKLIAHLSFILNTIKHFLSPSSSKSIFSGKAVMTSEALKTNFPFFHQQTIQI